MLVPANAPRELVDFSREEVNDKCPVCWETTEEDNGKLWCAHEHSNADLTDGTRIIVLVHPLHKDCAKKTYLFQKDYSYLKDCIHGADVKIMSVMPIPRSIRESLGYAFIRNAQTIALVRESMGNALIRNARTIELIVDKVMFIWLAIGILQTITIEEIDRKALVENIGRTDLLTRMVMLPLTIFSLPSIALYPLGGLAIVAVYRMTSGLTHTQDIINRLGMQLIGEEQDIIHLGMQLIGEEGIRLLNEEAEEIFEGVEENL